MTFSKKKTALVAVLVVVLAAAGVAAWQCRPADEEGMKRSAAVVVCRSWYDICAGGRPVVCFDSLVSDTAAEGFEPRKDEGGVTFRSAGCWVDRWPGIPSCGGRLVTTNADTILRHADIDRILVNARLSVGRERKRLKSEVYELGYWLRVHGVQDEGYQAVASLAQRKRKEKTTVERTSELLDSIAGMKGLTLRRRTEYTAFFRDADGRVENVRCRRTAFSDDRRAVLLRTFGSKDPSGIEPQPVMSWIPLVGKDILVIGFGGLAEPAFASPDAPPQIVPGRRRGRHHDFPKMLVPDGGPVFSVRGRFIGIVSGGTIVRLSAINKLMSKEGGDK